MFVSIIMSVMSGTGRSKAQGGGEAEGVHPWMKGGRREDCREAIVLMMG